MCISAQTSPWDGRCLNISITANFTCPAQHLGPTSLAPTPHLLVLTRSSFGQVCCQPPALPNRKPLSSPAHQHNLANFTCKQLQNQLSSSLLALGQLELFLQSSPAHLETPNNQSLVTHPASLTINTVRFLKTGLISFSLHVQQYCMNKQTNTPNFYFLFINNIQEYLNLEVMTIGHQRWMKDLLQASEGRKDLRITVNEKSKIDQPTLSP